MAKEWMLSDADLVPDDVQCELIDIRTKMTEDCFRIGKIANRLVLEATKAGALITAGRIHKAVGRFAGKSGRTVRYYAENAAFFSDESQMRYGFLPFSFFDFARNFGLAWEDVMILASDNPTCTLAWLRANYSLLPLVYMDAKISEDSHVTADKPGVADSGLAAVVGSRCAPNDLNRYAANQIGAHFTPLTNIGIAPQPGLTAAEFHFIHEVSYLVERAQLAISMSADDERVSEEVRWELRRGINAMMHAMRKFAKCIDKPFIEQVVQNVGVDSVG